MPESKPTREQERARIAYEKVDKIQNEVWKDDYGRMCMRLPTLIHQCGLCQAIAFCQAKGGDEKKDPQKKEVTDNAKKEAIRRFLLDLSSVVAEASTIKEFADSVRTAPFTKYQWLTRETLACSKWFKRYAEAILKVDLTKPEPNE